MNSMRLIIIAVAFLLHSGAANSQSIAPLTGNAMLIAESSRKVSLGWSDKTWSDYTPSELKWSRTAEGVEVLSGATGAVLVDLKTYFQYSVAAGVSKLTETVSENSTRDGKSLEANAAWKADRTYRTSPASWCQTNEHKVDSSFEVGPKEPYTLILDGKQVTLDVTPVVEQGWWTRCYSGKRYTRFLVSRELGTVVSIEHIGYTPQGYAHESSYRFNVKEIKRL
jgi:hypothetical protein